MELLVEVSEEYLTRGDSVHSEWTRRLFRFYADDAARAVAWYERLGFEREWDHQFDPGFPWFVSVARGTIHLYLSEHKGDARPNTLVHLYIDDIDRVSEEFGIPVDEEGLAGREVHLEDPSSPLRVENRQQHADTSGIQQPCQFSR
jgi:catechol 2,3-dioxygenase-like lactoylglutathione lyase family enzyme